MQSPGMKVVMPASAHDAKGLLIEAIRDQDPVLFCEPLRGYRLIKDEVPDERLHGAVRAPARGARGERRHARRLERRGRVVAERRPSWPPRRGSRAEVIDLRTLVPLDVDGLGEAVARTGRAVVDPRGAAHRRLRRRGGGDDRGGGVLRRSSAPVLRVAAPDAPYPIASLERDYLPSAERALGAIRRVMGAG